MGEIVRACMSEGATLGKIRDLIPMLEVEISQSHGRRHEDDSSTGSELEAAGRFRPMLGRAQRSAKVGRLSGRIRPELGQIVAGLVQTCPRFRPKFGPTLAKSRPIWAISDEPGPTWPRFGPGSSKFGRIRPNLDQLLARLGRGRPNSARCWQTWPEFADMLATSAECGPTLAEVGPKMTNIGRYRPDLGEHWHGLCHMLRVRPDVGPSWGPNLDTKVEFNQKSFKALRGPRCQGSIGSA